MKIGGFIFPTATSIDVATLARHAEAAGFESLWIPEHPVMPVNPYGQNTRNGFMA